MCAIILVLFFRSYRKILVQFRTFNYSTNNVARSKKQTYPEIICYEYLLMLGNEQQIICVSAPIAFQGKMIKLKQSEH